VSVSLENSLASLLNLLLNGKRGSIKQKRLNMTAFGQCLMIPLLLLLGNFVVGQQEVYTV